MKQRFFPFAIFIGVQATLFGIFFDAFGVDKASLPPPPPPPPFLKQMSSSAELAANEPIEGTKSQQFETSTLIANEPPKTLEDEIPHGQNLVSIDFPNGVNLTDIIKTIGVWAGKNFVLGQGIAGNSKISIMAPEPMTKEEAYQTFLSALNISGFTTVETGKIVKILPIPTAKSTNIKTYYGANWAPETDEIINQVIPLKFIDARSLLDQLRPLLGLTTSVAFTSTNSIILTDTGFRIKSLLEVIQLLDNRKDQPQVEIIPINYMDAKDANQKVNDVFGSRYGPSLSLQKSLVDERTNSVILIGPVRGLDDIVKFIKRIDKPTGADTQGFIRVRPLDYADAEKLAQTLQAFSQNQAKTGQQGFFPPRFQPYNSTDQNSNNPQTTPSPADLSNVKIASDKATNSLIIQGSKGAYAEINSLIEALDKRRNQIYLEADILDLQVTNALDWEPSALGGSQLNSKRFLMPYGFNPSNASSFSLNNTGSTQIFQSALSQLGPDLLLGILSNTAVTLGGFQVQPGAILFAVKTDSNTNVLQTPSMMVSDNETAKFNSTQQYRTVVNVSNPNGQGVVGSPQSYDVTTSLNVTPQISRADYINLKINLQLDDAGPQNKDGYPNPINKRSAESVLTLRSGQTAVMGGLTKESNKESQYKIPLLGDIPILGWLFKTVMTEKIKSNLTLFLTPYVVKNSGDLAKIYQKKLKDRDEFLKIYYGKNYKKEEFYKSLRGPESGKAVPDKPENTNNLNLQNNTRNGEKLAADSREQALPSQNKDPIVAPVQNNIPVSQFSSYSHAIPNPMPAFMPPPPPPSPVSVPQTIPVSPPILSAPIPTAGSTTTPVTAGQ